MNPPPDFPPAAHGRLDPNRTVPARFAGPLAEQWAALNEAGRVVAALCGPGRAPIETEIAANIRDFPAAMATLRGVRREMAENGISDLTAMMEPGIAALLAIRAAGADPAPAAATLLQEFESARAAILALLPPEDIRRR